MCAPPSEPGVASSAGLPSLGLLTLLRREGGRLEGEDGKPWPCLLCCIRARSLRVMIPTTALCRSTT